MPGGIPASACLKQEPGAPFGLVNPHFDQAGSGNVAVLFADTVGFAKARGESLAVLTQFSQHVLRFDILCIVVRYALQASDMANGPERGTPDLPDALGDGVGHGEKLVTLFVEQQMIVAEVWPAHVPVEVLGLEVKRERVRQDRIHGACDILGRRRFQVGRGDKRRLLHVLE
jgi:hypothetical protein